MLDTCLKQHSQCARHWKKPFAGGISLVSSPWIRKPVLREVQVSRQSGDLNLIYLAPKPTLWCIRQSICLEAARALPSKFTFLPGLQSSSWSGQMLCFFVCCGCWLVPSCCCTVLGSLALSTSQALGFLNFPSRSHVHRGLRRTFQAQV